MLYTRKVFDYEYDIEDADIAVLGIPWDSTETGTPVRFGPLFIREAIKNLPGFDPETNVNIFKKLKFCDLGDIDVVHGNWKLTADRIDETIKEIFERNKKIKPIFFGGDHLITLGVLSSLSRIIKKRITVIDFDAHSDILPEWMGEPYNHITWAYHALKNLDITLIQIGCRSWTEEEHNSPLKKRIKNILPPLHGPVYITIDMDVIDPSHAPEVGTPEPLGMDPKDLFTYLKKSSDGLIGFDIVECASERPGTQTAHLSANIFKKILAYYERDKRHKTG